MIDQTTTGSTESMNERLRAAADAMAGVLGTLGAVTLSDINTCMAIAAGAATAVYMSIRAVHAWRRLGKGNSDD